MNKGTGKDEETKTPRRTFSVSKEFESILSEIDYMPNMSRFVCEAIHEKLQRVKNPNKDLQEALAQFVQIQQVIGGQQSPSSPQVPTDPFQHINGATQPTPASPVQRTEERQDKEPVKEEPSTQAKEETVQHIEKDIEEETVNVSTANEKTEIEEQIEGQVEKQVEEQESKQVTQAEPTIKKEEEEVITEFKQNFLIPRKKKKKN